METKTEQGKDPAIAAGSDGIYVAWSGASGLEARVLWGEDPVLLDKDGAFVLAVTPGGRLRPGKTREQIKFQLLQ